MFGSEPSTSRSREPGSCDASPSPRSLESAGSASRVASASRVSDAGRGLVHFLRVHIAARLPAGVSRKGPAAGLQAEVRREVGTRTLCLRVRVILTQGQWCDRRTEVAGRRPRPRAQHSVCVGLRGHPGAFPGRRPWAVNRGRGPGGGDQRGSRREGRRD